MIIAKKKKKKTTQCEMTIMPLKSGLKYFYFNNDRVLTFCMQKRNIKKGFRPNVLFLFF